MDYGKVVDEIFGQIEGVRFDIRLWDKRKLRYGQNSSSGKKAFTLVFEDEMAAKRLLSQGALGFGESYMSGALRIEGDLEAYLRLRHQFKKIKPSVRLAAAAFLASRKVPKDRKDQIAYHYDLGNDFFKLFLDSRTMSYSAGLYGNGTESLSTAQQRKIEMICEWLELSPGATVLDLGSGWGGFAHYAAQQHRWSVTGYTLSREQLEYCNRLIKRESLEKLVSIEYRDMIDDLPDGKSGHTGQFDAVVMLESIEHVGKQRLHAYVQQLHDILRPGGKLYIQATGRYVSRQADAWTLKYVFPGGYLPAKQELLDAAAAAGLEVDSFAEDTPSYILTMTEWVKRFEKNRSVIESMYDPPFYRLWELWMHGAKVAFEVDAMNLFRIRLTRPK